MVFPWGEHSQGNPYRTETESFKLGQAEKMGSQIKRGRKKVEERKMNSYKLKSE